MVRQGTKVARDDDDQRQKCFIYFCACFFFCFEKLVIIPDNPIKIRAYSLHFFTHLAVPTKITS